MCREFFLAPAATGLLIGAHVAPAAASGALAGQSASPSAAGLQIVVIEGEDAVNIVQQKTAVAPVVEVRDRNNQPVAGVVVRFAVRNGRATFNGARTLSVTTNAAGRAVAAGLTPTGSGALQIGASAAFQGQTAVATIVQTNVMTVAQAAGAAATAGSASGGAGGAGSGGAAGGAGGGAGGGGLSATTIGIVGGAVAGGAIATKEVLGGGGDNSVHYAGPYAGSVVEGFGGACTATIAHSGTVHVDLEVATDGTASGTGSVQGTMTVTAANAACGSAFPINSSQTHGCCAPDAQVNGNSGNFSFSGSHPGNAGTNWTYDFSGALNGTTITGTFTLTTLGSNLTTIRPFPVTLSKQ